MITITLTGFKTKQEAIYWLNQYEGSVEQSFDTDEPEDNCFPAMTNMEPYLQEMKDFKKDEFKTNFNLELK
jgi:hypothetical protein